LRIVPVDLEGKVMEIAPLGFGLYRDDFECRAHRTDIRKKRGTIASKAPI
jgi:hypothetical protein